ncbi:sensor histidine kinase [Sphingomicrobium arenosum]|uniref:sensor histidine kinase n=1 Tax=Sphingomicrobium arenosum TaxID=2233861 RepID=UPI00223F1279|nr:ATP-binding protein [Sphingomicrobium arenosum]
MKHDIIKVRIEEEADIMRVRQVADQICRSLHLERFARTRCVTACLEIARNILQYAQQGTATFRYEESGGRSYLAVRFVDQGPGFEIKQSTAKGRAFYRAKAADNSDSGGLGLGLSGAQRLSDQFEIESGSEGTSVYLAFEAVVASADATDTIKRIADDITRLNSADPVVELSRQNRELAEALAERELLIAEVHHRTGNNLALVSSIIQMASRKAKTDEARDLLAETENRIHSIVRVHQDLQHAQSQNEIAALPFLEAIATNSINAFSHVGKDINVSVDGDAQILPSDLMADLGLLVGELITNSVKHAFPNRDHGTVCVRLQQTDEGEESYRLVVEDDGVGLPDGERPERSSSLGWRLIRSIASRHEATLSVEGASGLQVELRFSL